MKYIFFFLLFPLFSFAQFLNPSTPYILSSGPSEGYERPRVVVTANNSPFVIWSKASSPKAIKGRKWNGTNFDSTFDLVNADLMPTGFIGPEISAKGDTMYLIFESLLHNNHIIYLKRSFDGGLTFSDTIRVSDNSNTHKFAMPNISVRDDGNPVVSYMECLPNWTDWKQVVKSSFNFGTSFSPATDVSALAPGEPCDCCQSTLVTYESNVYLLFRNDDSNVRNTYIAKSTDNGLNFSANKDLDDINWVLNACPTSSPVGAVLGDSIMIVRRNGGSGVNELYKSNVNKDDLQKSYFSQVESSGSSLQDKAEIATDLNNFVSIWEENRNGNKDCFYSVIGSDGKSLYNGIISDTATFGHKIEPDISYGGPYLGNFSVVYTASSEREVHFLYATLTQISYIDESINLNSKKLNKSVNFLGKNVIPSSNEPFINIYNDGSVERKIVLE
tara:strand:- start:114 stop:1448 length:1335 start_codon:yes stop_codon:yes gene_type:complete